MNDTPLVDRDGVLQDVGRTERLWAKGEFQEFLIGRIAVENLTLNPENRRFRADREAVESQLGRTLELPADEDAIIRLLLDRDCRGDVDRVVSKPSPETAALVADWSRRGQERPLWIEPSGLVRNGNRRLAMIKRELAATGEERFRYVDVIVLDPHDFDDASLFDMEALEQLTEGLKVKYTDINLLLTLREAAERAGVDWHSAKSIGQAAERIAYLVGNDPRYARVQLDAVKYMGDFLRLINQAGHYGQLRGKVEVFRDVGKNMRWAAENDRERSLEMLEVCFAAVMAGAGHLDIREIRKIADKDPDAFTALAQEIRDVRERAPAEAGEEPPASEDPDDEDAEETGDRDTPVTDFPRHAVKGVIDLATLMSKARHNAQPERDLRLAADHLARVSADDLSSLLEGVGAEHVARARDEIVGWADAVRAAETPPA
jgi:hypothetical protein